MITLNSSFSSAPPSAMVRGEALAHDNGGSTTLRFAKKAKSSVSYCPVPLGGLDALRARHPWPEISGLDGDPPHVWSLDGGGRELITDVIQKMRPRVILEIGTFLGGSALRWLATRPDFALIVMDPWTKDAGNWVATVIASPPVWVQDIEPLKPIWEAIQRHGIAKVALHNLRSFRGRVIPIQMPAETGCAYVRSFVEPDMVYIDAMKQPQDYMLAHQLFPTAVMCGDDWTWQDEGGGYPVRGYVHHVAGLRGCTVLAKDQTWVLAQN